MAKYKCNSCGSVYEDVQQNGTAHYHTCSPEVIEHAEFDAAGKVVKPEKRTPRTDVRDERPAPGYVYIEGKPHVEYYHQGAGAFVTELRDAHPIVSEGKGRTRID